MKTLKIVSFGIKNNKVLAGFMLLICGFVLPVIAVMYNQGHRGAGIDEYVPVFGTVMAYFAGLLFPIVLFSYTHNRRENDFYAAMPVKRRQYFWGYFFSGIIMFVVPIAVTDVIMLMFFGNRGHAEPAHFAGPLAIFFSIYCSMTLAVMFSGSVVSSIITFILRNIFIVCLTAPILFMSGVDVSSYFILLHDKAIISAPLLGVFPFAEINHLWQIWLWQTGIGIVEIIIAFFLHKYRSSETTMALAFPKSRYPYQYIVTLMFVMTVNTVVLIMLGFARGIFSSLYPDIRTVNSYEIKTIVFFDIIGALIIFILLNIVLERSSRAAFKKMRHLIFFLMGFFAISALSSGLLSYIPRIYTPIDPDYAVVTVYRLPDPPYAYESMSDEEILEGIKSGKYLADYYYSYTDDGEFEEIRVNWLLIREEAFVTISKQKLNALKKICEGEVEYYDIYHSYFTNFGNSEYNYSYMMRGLPYYGNDSVYFDIKLAKGDCYLQSGVCSGYSIKKGIGRRGYVIGSSSELDVYKDWEMEL